VVYWRVTEILGQKGSQARKKIGENRLRGAKLGFQGVEGGGYIYGTKRGVNTYNYTT